MTAKNPCIHGLYDAHGDCNCRDHRQLDKGLDVWEKGYVITGEEYMPDKFVPCTHNDPCPGGEYVTNSIKTKTHTYDYVGAFLSHSQNMEANGWATTIIVNIELNRPGQFIIIATYQKDNT
jgi:hypothetical protein